MLSIYVFFGFWYLGQGMIIEFVDSINLWYVEFAVQALNLKWQAVMAMKMKIVGEIINKHPLFRD